MKRIRPLMGLRFPGRERLQRRWRIGSRQESNNFQMILC